MGFGALGLAGLLSRTQAFAGGSEVALKPHFAAKATRVIHIFAQGGPSHVDTWDPKPELNRRDGQELPEVKGVAMGSNFKFARHGKSGIEVSEVFPQLAKHVDDMTVIRSMHTDIPAHDVATVFMNTGSLRMAKPSLGAWALYGLGSENENMPGFISLRPGGSAPGGVLNWGSAFLPGKYQATSINTSSPSVEQMIQNIRNQYLGAEEQRRQLDFVQKLNHIHQQNLQEDPQLEARIQSFEMAYKMQMEATDAFDISRESRETRDLYTNTPQGRQLLIARR
ncbi:MAG TPA: DUF1501 domain-containing protein, partial [Verrucomicrobiales bacterium]|nr:DUF1501 domain-containing protein [Verrucomicrobiales bacterium]